MRSVGAVPSVGVELMILSYRSIATGLASLPILLTVGAARGDDAVLLEERPKSGQLYQVRARVQLSGQLTVPAEKDKESVKTVAVQGESAAGALRGQTLLDIANDDYARADTRDEARRLLRELIAQRLGGQTLHTRAVLKELQDL